MMENNEPLALKIHKAQEEMMISILGIQSKYEFPAYLMEMIINNCMLDVKTCSNRELINSLNINEEDKKKEEKNDNF